MTLDGGLRADGIRVRRLGREGEPLAMLVVDVRLADGSYLEIGREPLGANFSSFWSLNPRHLQALRDGSETVMER